MSDPHNNQYSHIGGTTSELLDRFAVSEICKGWTVYRDASEWANYRSLFTDDAYTTWSGPQTIDNFIQLSIQGKTTAGAHIMHRECGTLVELNPQNGRAVGKMKAVITQRFAHPEGFEYDVDCDCRFVFFCERVRAPGRHDWRAAFVKLVYEKDRLVPVDGVKVPYFADEVLERYPAGYRYLGAAQNTLGYEIDRGLVTGEDAKACEVMYRNMERWLDEPTFCRSFHPE